MRTVIFGATVGAVFGLCCFGAGRAGEPVNPNLSAEARQVFDYLKSTYQKQVLAGYNVYVHTPDDYEQTGKQAAVWGRDIRWLGDVQDVAEHAKRLRYILTLHWHWHFDEDSAWTGKRKTPVDVGKMVTPGTNEYKQAIAEMDAAADKLQILEDASIPAKWLYALPWWGAPSQRRPADWAVMTMRHDFIVTLDELPAFGEGNIAPHVGILRPLDDGSARFVDEPVRVKAYAVDRDGEIERVDFCADDKLIESDQTAPFEFTWNEATAGCYDLTVVAIDDKDEQTRSNKVRTIVGLVDVACGKQVVASSGESPQNAVDGDYYSAWSSDKSDNEWIYVDLGNTYRVDQVNLLWGWKIHAADFAIEVAVGNPDALGSWTEVFSAADRAYQTWEATDRVRFKPTDARYVRLRATKRAGNQTWSGYKLAAMEIPVAPELVTQDP